MFVYNWKFYATFAIQNSNSMLINNKEYFSVLEEYAVNGNLQPFTEMILTLESERLKEYLTLVPHRTNHL